MDEATLGRAKHLAQVGAGALLLGIGAALLVLPGPGIPVLLGGLALLAPKVAWARRLRDRVLRRVTPGDARGEDDGRRVA